MHAAPHWLACVLRCGRWVVREVQGVVEVQDEAALGVRVAPAVRTQKKVVLCLRLLGLMLLCYY